MALCTLLLVCPLFQALSEQFFPCLLEPGLLQGRAQLQVPGCGGCSFTPCPHGGTLTTSSSRPSYGGPSCLLPWPRKSLCCPSPLPGVSAVSAGGGSALLPAPIPPVTLEEKQTLTKLLAARGATIQELNTIRKALSQLKGGGLAQAAYPAQVVSLILSDVVGDPVEVIASGPTVASIHSVQDCLHILNRYGLRAALPRSVKTVLARADSDPHGPHACGHVLNVVIGSNALALAEAQRQAEALGYRAVVLSTAMQGDVGSVAQLYGLLAQVAGAHLTLPGAGASVEEEDEQFHELMSELRLPDLQLREALEAVVGTEGPVCLLAGGEPTVQLQGSGMGGRNQELALRVGAELGRRPLGSVDVLFLSGGTDGQDGPTEAAGAWVMSDLTGQATAEGLDVATFLAHNDSHTFFRCFHGGAHLLCTGLTGTNVMDIHLLFLRPR